MSFDPYSVFCLRYYPNLASGEFVNVGVALVSRAGSWKVRITTDFRDIRCLFPDAQVTALKHVLTKLSDRLHEGAGALMLDPAAEEDPLAPIRRRAERLNGSLRWSDVVFDGAAASLEEEIEYWFPQLVQVDNREDKTKKVAAPRTESPEAAAKRIMAEEFNRRGVLPKLRSARIGRMFRFDFTYQNGSLNIFEPVRLNFKKHDTVLEKGQLWRGKLDILGEQAGGPVGFFALVDVSEDPALRGDTEFALAVINASRIQRVETVPLQEVRHFGQLALDVVTEDGGFG